MAYKLSPSRVLIFAIAVFLSFSLFDTVSDWCQEKEGERSYPWSVTVGFPQLSQRWERALCRGVHAVQQECNVVCPNNSPGFLESIFTERGGLARNNNDLLCQYGRRAYEILALRKYSAKISEGVEAMQGIATSACKWIFQLVGRKPSDFCLFDENAAASRLDDSLRGLYDDLWEEEEIFDYESCNCEVQEDTGKDNTDDIFTYLTYGCVACVLLAGASLVYFLRRPIKSLPEVVVWTTLSGAVKANFKALKLLQASSNMNTFLMSCRSDTNRLVYTKLLRSDCSRSARRRLLSELKALKTLKHPNIVKLVDSVRVGSRFTLGTEYAPCGSLDKIMAHDRGCFKLSERKALFRQVIEAVAWIHTQRWVHLNIRASSILVFDKWCLVKLSGFSRATKLVGGALCTTFDLHRACCSPMVLKKQPYNPVRADVWALRNLFWFINTGELLNPGEDAERPLNLDILVCDCKDVEPSGHGLNLLKVLSEYSPAEVSDHSYFAMV